MPAPVRHPGNQPLPGPGTYRLEGGGADICICLISLAAMLRQFLPALPAEGYQALESRVIDADLFRADFLSGDEIEQVNGFKSLKKQVEWIGGRYALKTLVAMTHPAAGTARQVQIAYEPRGAPYLVNNPGISISISHAGEYALAGVCGDAERRIGLDVERIGGRGLAEVMRVAFTDREIAAVNNSPDEACRIWTCKEAYLKFVKTGFRESLKRVDVSGSTIVHGGVPVSGLGIRSLRVGERYLLTVVYSQIKGR